MAYRILEGCPCCGGYPVSPSPARGFIARVRQLVTGRQPFQCEQCGWRGWAHESWDRRQRDLPPPGGVDRRKTGRAPEPPA